MLCWRPRQWDLARDMRCLQIVRASHHAARDAVVVWVQVDGRDALGVKDTLANEYGIMVRHYRKELLDGFVRISVGKPEQTDALIAALRDLEATGGNGSV